MRTARALALLLAFALASGSDVEAQRREVRGEKTPAEIGRIVKGIGEKVRADLAKSEKEDFATLARLQPLAKALAISPALASVFLIDWLPITQDGFRGVFGKAVAADRQSEEDIRRSRALFGASWGSPHTTADLDALFQRVRHEHSFVVIRGHNFAGQIQLPGDSFLGGSADQRTTFSIAEVAVRCRASGLFCIFLSCAAAQHLPVDGVNLYGSARAITIGDALSLSAFIYRKVELLRKDLEANPNASLDELQTFGVGISRAVNAPIFGQLFVLISEGVIIGLLFSDSASECNDNDKCKLRIVRYEEAPYGARKRH